MRISVLLFLAAAVVSPIYVTAQESPRPAGLYVYKVDITIRDASETASAGRRYSMLIEGGSKGTFRIGSKVPYTTGTAQSGQAAPVATQYSYADIGVSIDARLREMGSQVGLSADIDVSNLVKSSTGGVLLPTIGSIRISVNSVLNPGKPTMVASIDDPVTARRFDIEATVTKVN
jgi:hypothetical protein